MLLPLHIAIDYLIICYLSPSRIHQPFDLAIRLRRTLRVLMYIIRATFRFSFARNNDCWGDRRHFAKLQSVVARLNLFMDFVTVRPRGSKRIRRAIRVRAARESVVGYGDY